MLYLCITLVFERMFVIYLKLEKYLMQWLTHSLGNPVRFPAQSNENAVISRFLTKLPEEKSPEMFQEGLTPIVIPESKAKDPTIYNYLGPRAKEAVIESIEDLFRRNMWAELGDMMANEQSVGVNKIVAAWCEMHGIDDDYIETVRQKFYRIRKAYTNKGINLQSLTRIRGDKQPCFDQQRT